MAEPLRRAELQESVQNPLTLSSWNRRGRWRLLALILILGLLPMVGYLVGRRSATPDELIAQASPPPPQLLTVPVERRTLEGGDVLSGRVVLDREQLTLGLPSQRLVTSVNVRSGDLLEEGGLLLALDDRPLFVLQGELPLIRPLMAGERGSVVEQLQESLIRLGYLQGEPDGIFGSGTRNALRAMYRDAGFSMQATAPEPDSNQLAPMGESSPSVITIPVSEILFMPELPLEVDEVHVVRGSVLADDALLFSVLPESAHIEVDEDAPGRGFQPEISTGTFVVRSDLGEDLGTATLVEVQSRSLEDGSSLSVAILRPSTNLDAYDRRPVQVIANHQVLQDVLVVPVSALRADAAGVPYVLVDEEGRPARIDVELGFEAGGFVEIRNASALEEGTPVVVGETR